MEKFDFQRCISTLEAKNSMDQILWNRNLVTGGKNGRPIVYDVVYREGKSKLPIVIFAHGFKGFKDWGPFNLVAQEFAKNNFFTLKFNFSHNGGLPDDPIDFPDLEAFGENNYSKEQDDFQSIINLLVNQESDYEGLYDLDKIYLIGHSRGGAGAIIFSASCRRVKKLAAWSSPANLEIRMEAYDLVKWKDEGVVLIENGRTKQKMPLYYQFYEDLMANSARFSIANAVKNLRIPFLVVHGTNDQTVQVEEARLFPKWNNAVVLVEIDKAGHTFDGAHPHNKEDLPQAFKNTVSRTIDFFKNG